MVPVKVTGVDHIYLAVSDFDRSQSFYDGVMQELGFKKGDMAIAGEPHAHYFNPSLQISIRPARTDRPHDPYSPGLHHICLRLPDEATVDAAAKALTDLGVAVTPPARYPEYAPDYYAAFFEDPDGIRFELVALRELRRAISDNWNRLEGFLNPLARLRGR